jgi:serine O-acetyltransferase
MMPDKRPRISIAETLRLIRSDHAAVVAFFKPERGRLSTLVNFMLHPGFICITLHRIAFYFHARGMKLVARLIYLTNVALTSADLSPTLEVGERFILLHPTGTILAGKIGKNVLMTAANGMGGDGTYGDIGAGEGLPVIGDRVVMGARANVMGPNKVDDDAFVCAMSLVLKYVPPGATVFGIPARQIKNSVRNELSAPAVGAPHA